MKSMGLLDECSQRGLIAQSTDYSALEQHLQTGKRSVYCGFDPTAGSLHVGHLLMLAMLSRFQRAGHRVLALVGGGTGQIGDPSFKAQERSTNPTALVAKWSQCCSQQLNHLFETTDDSLSPVEFVDNIEWLQPLDLLSFLREVGKAFSVNALLKRQAIAQRLERADQGISYAEFTYPLLQAYDFLRLYQSRAVTIQIGGSDQWGNLVAGMDLIRSKDPRADVHGLTVPLMLQSNGKKFGKTEHGTVWLDAQKTSPYAFFQFWYRTPDAQVFNLLKQMTFLPLSQLSYWQSEYEAGSLPSNALQTILADNLTQWVHGPEALTVVHRLKALLFQVQYNQLCLEDFEQLATGGLPLFKIPLDWSGTWLELLAWIPMIGSKREARVLANGNALFVNGQPLTIDYLSETIATQHYYHDKYLILRKGKKNFLLIVKAEI